MTETSTITLLSTNKSDKRKKVNDSYRIIEYENQKAIDFENEQVDFETILKTFFKDSYYDKYMKNKDSIGGTQKQVIIEVLKQIYTDVILTQNLLNKRKKDFYLCDLHNEDGTPIPREDKRKNNGREMQEFTCMFSALLLLALNNNTIDSELRTLQEWLEYFNFATSKQRLDYYDLQMYGTDETNWQEKNKARQQVLDIVSSRLEELEIDRRYFAKRSNHEVVERKTRLSEKELEKIYESFYHASLEALKRRIKQILIKLHSAKMIRFTSYKVGIIKGDKKRYELNSKEIHAYNLLEVRVKEELDLHHLHNSHLYMNKRFRERISELLQSEGLNTEDGTTIYQSVFTAFTITKYFTQTELNDFLDDNEKIKNYYLESNEKLIDLYRNERTKNLDDTYKKKIDRYIKRLESTEKKRKKKGMKTGKEVEQYHDLLKEENLIFNLIEHEKKNHEFSLQALEYYQDNLMNFLYANK